MRGAILLLGVLVAVSACSSASDSRNTSATSSVAPTAPHRSSAVRVPAVEQSTPAVRLECRDVIHDAATPYAGMSVVFDRVALPTGTTLQVSPSGERSPNARLFAKWGLLIRPGTSFELVVPRAWSSRLTIGWGNPGRPAERLLVENCPAAAGGADWLAFAGGYWVRDPMCVPLIVRADGREQTVHIAVGTPCPEARN